MTRRRYVQLDGELVEVGADYVPVPQADYHVMPDLEPFRDNTGTVISGRVGWREHLKRNGLQEFGHADVKGQQAVHERLKQDKAAKLARAGDAVKAVDAPVMEGRVDRPRIGQEVANRLHGRPMPDRKTLIRIALEEARRGQRRR